MFNYRVDGFAYPFGDFNPAIEAQIRNAGHTYARTTIVAADIFPAENPMAMPTHGHFRSPEFWDRFEHVAKMGGVFYFWGHSYENVTEADWETFDRQIERLSTDSRLKWVDLPELFGAVKQVRSV